MKFAVVGAALTATSLLVGPSGLGATKPKVGQPCQTTKQYAGFVCSQLNSGARPTLFRLVRPGPAPTRCPAAEPTQQSAPPGSTSESIDLNPLWVRADVRVVDGTSAWRTSVKRKHVGGWPVKWLWQAAPNTAPLRVSITDMRRGGKLVVAIHGSERNRSTTLDAGNVLVEPANSWSSYVLFPGAGCYRLDVSWPQGRRSLVFGFGR